MKIYGAEKNKETIVCKWGCCGGVISKPRKGSAFSKAVAKARRKSARRWKNKQYVKDEKENDNDSKRISRFKIKNRQNLQP